MRGGNAHLGEFLARRGRSSASWTGNRTRPFKSRCQGGRPPRSTAARTSWQVPELDSAAACSRFQGSESEFEVHLQQLTSVKVDPDGRVLELKDKKLFDYPWI